MRLPPFLATLAAAFLAAAPLPAQVILEPVLPERPRPEVGDGNYAIDLVAVHARVDGQAAEVQLDQVFRNTGSGVLEARFLFPLPPDAAVRGLTLLVDGKELTGKLMDANEARGTYEAIVRKQQDPALLEYAGRGLYRTSVFPIPAGAERTVQIKYSQLLPLRGGMVDLTLPVGTAGRTAGRAGSGKPVKKFTVDVRVGSDSPIRTVHSPTHDVAVERPDDTHAVAKLDLENVVAPDDVRLLYGTADGMVGLNLVTYRPDGAGDGYFLLLAAPEVPRPDSEPPPRTLSFVVDTSGSMQGEKIEQARGALQFLLSRLRDGDTFNLLSYDTDVTPFRPELQRGTPDAVDAAKSFAGGLYAGGSTDIDAALTTALDMLPDGEGGKAARPTYTLFLTDGLPTAGVTEESQIVENAAAANDAGSRLFCFGVGYDVNARLLDRLAAGGRGTSVYVRPNEDIEAAVADLFGKIASPALTDVRVTFDPARTPAADAPPAVNRVLPGTLPDLFHGEQLVLVGRYTRPGPHTVSLAGTVTGGDEDRATFSLATDLPATTDGSTAFVETLWATRRIGELIAELDAKGRNQELVDELVALSTKHGILTPYTAFLAEEGTDLLDLAGNNARGLRESESLMSNVSGALGVEQRRFKQKLAGSARGQSTDEYGVEYQINTGAGSGITAGRGGLGGGGFGGGGSGGYDGGASPGGSHGYFEMGAGRSAGSTGRPSAPAYAADPDYSAAIDAPADSEAEELRRNPIRRVGGRAFFYKEGRWRDATLTEETAKDPVTVEQYSDAYFKLAAKDGGTFAKFLTFAQPVLVRLGETTYLISPPEEEKEAGE